MTKFFVEPLEDGALIVDCRAPNLRQQMDTVRLWRRGVLEAFIAVGAKRPQIFGVVASALRFV
ncbi:MAG TPA: hypothetical protein PLV87_12395 [Opitutaceae bacterium]|nr:hypothetical protein [Opitutaceae bacterium]